jgi:hypothetical protein
MRTVKRGQEEMFRAQHAQIGENNQLDSTLGVFGWFTRTLFPAACVSPHVTGSKPDELAPAIEIDERNASKHFRSKSSPLLAVLCAAPRRARLSRSSVASVLDLGCEQAVASIFE